MEVGDAVVVTVDYRDQGKSNPTKVFGLVTEVGQGDLVLRWCGGVFSL